MTSVQHLDPHRSPSERLGRPALEMTFRGHRQGVLCAAFQPSHHSNASEYSMAKSSVQGRRAVLPPKVLTGGADGAVMLWDTKPTTRALRFLGHRGPVLGCDYSPKSLLIASCGHDGYARLVIPNLMRTSTTYPSPCSLQQRNDDYENSFSWRVHTGAARAIAFAQDTTDRLYTIGDDKSIKCWNLNYVSSTPSGMGFYGNKLASFSVAAMCSTPEASFAAVHRGHTNWIRCLAVQRPTASGIFSHYLASGGDDRCVYVWDTRARRAAHTFFEPKASVHGLSFHPNGYHLASGDANGNVNVFDLRVSSSKTLPEGPTNVQETWRYGLFQHYRTAHEGTVYDVNFAPGGSWLLSAGEDGNVKIWDTCEGILYCTIQAHDSSVRTSRFSEDGQFFVTAGKDNVVMLWRSGLSMQSDSSPDDLRRCSTDPVEETHTALLNRAHPHKLSICNHQAQPRQDHVTMERKAKLPGLLASQKVPLFRQRSPSKITLSAFPAQRTSSKGPRAGSKKVQGLATGTNHMHGHEAATPALAQDDTPSAASDQPQQRECCRSDRAAKRTRPTTRSFQISDEDNPTNGHSEELFDAQKEGPDQNHEAGQKKGNGTHQEKPVCNERVENIEHALVTLLEHFQKEQSVAREEIQQLKQVWENVYERQQEDIRGLRALVEKLLDQQSMVMKHDANQKQSIKES